MKCLPLISLLLTLLISASVACATAASVPASLIPSGDFQADTQNRGWPDGKGKFGPFEPFWRGKVTVSSNTAGTCSKLRFTQFP
jgi:hypothetical protein